MLPLADLSETEQIKVYFEPIYEIVTVGSAPRILSEEEIGSLERACTKFGENIRDPDMLPELRKVAQSVKAHLVEGHIPGFVRKHKTLGCFSETYITSCMV